MQVWISRRTTAGFINGIRKILFSSGYGYCQRCHLVNPITAMCTGFAVKKFPVICRACVFKRNAKRKRVKDGKPVEDAK